MGENSKIEWTHHTFNPWRGCTKVSAGCANCYASRQAKRNPDVLGIWGDNGTRVVASEAMWREPLRWNRDALAAGERRRVFCASMADVFEARESLDEPRRRLFRLIDETPGLDWLLLTKRPQNWSYVKPASWEFNGVPRNVWIGVSVENQAAADERIPLLLQVPAAVRFLSCEPLLSAVDLLPYIAAYASSGDDERYLPLAAPEIGWVIAGGESGPGARPCKAAWVRSIVKQCRAAGVACFVKQLGADVRDRDDAGFDGQEPGAWPDSGWFLPGRIQDDPDNCGDRGYQGAEVRVRLRDPKGGDWSEWPEDLRVRQFPEVARA